MNRISLLLFLVVSSFTLFSQPAGFQSVNQTEKKQYIDKIAQASKTITTFQAHFTQEKEFTFLTTPSKSAGEMYYKAPQSLRWEYTTPNPFIMILHQNKITVKDDQGVTHTNADKNKMMKSICSLMIGLMNGNELSNSTNFNIGCYQKGNELLLILTPSQKELQKAISTIYIYMNSPTFFPTQIVVNEAGGDITRLFFNKPIKNQNISNSLFTIQ